MASKSLTGSFNGSGKAYATPILQLSSTSDTSSNTSDITYKLYVKKNISQVNTYKVSTPVKITINGKTQSKTVNFNISSTSAGSQYLVTEGTFTDIAHSSDGTKTVSCSATIDLSGTSLGKGSISGSFKLDNIPRYVNSSLKNTSIALNTASFSFTTDAASDNAKYRLYNSSGSKTKEVDIGSNKSFTITGLSPGTKYSVDVYARRTGTSLYKASNKVSFTTKAIATITNSIDFTLGNTIPVKLSNPSGVSMTLALIAGSSTIWSANIGNVSSYTISLNSTQILNLYKLIPNATSGKFALRVTITSNGSTYNSEKSGTFYINSSSSTSKPTVSSSSISFTDRNNIANGNIIQNKSSLRITISGGAGSSSSGASIKSWAVSFNGVTKSSNYSTSAVNFDFGVPTTSGTYNVSLVVTDSRGVASSAAIKSLTVHPYSNPSLYVELNRVNGYEANVTLDITARVTTSTGFTNNIKTCTWIRRSVSDSSTTSSKTISAAIGLTAYSATTANFDTPSIDSGYWYDFRMTDQLNTQVSVTVFVAEGRPALIIAEDGSVGIGSYAGDDCKCHIGGTLKVDEDIIIFANTENGDKNAMSVWEYLSKIDSIKSHAYSNPVTNLTSTSTTLALAASMGKQLNDKFSNYMPKSGGTFSGNVTINGTLSTGGQTKINGWVEANDVRSNSYWVKNMLLSDVNESSKVISLGYGASQNLYRLGLNGYTIELTPSDQNKVFGITLQAFKEGSGNLRTIFRSSTNGGAYLGSASYCWNTGFFTNTITQSDRKIKDNITLLDADKAVQFIMAQQPSSYTLKNSDRINPRLHMGLIAQDVAQSAKDVGMGDLSLYQAAVIQEGYEDEQPYSSQISDENLSWGLNYNEFIAPIIRVEQVLYNEIQQLKEAISNLKSN